MFQRSHLSRVQLYGLELIDSIAVVREMAERKDESVRLAILSHDPSSFPRLFPEMLSSTQRAELNEEKLESDHSEFESDIAPDDALEIMQQINAGSVSGTFSLDDLEFSDGSD